MRERGGCVAGSEGRRARKAFEETLSSAPMGRLKTHEAPLSASQAWGAHGWA